MLSIIIPVRNEADNLEDIFDYFSNNLKNLNYEALIVNDFSRDNTLTNAKVLCEKSKNFKVLDNKKKGLGGVINLGIEKAKGEKIVVMMADMSDDLNDLIEN